MANATRPLRAASGVSGAGAAAVALLALVLLTAPDAALAKTKKKTTWNGQATLALATRIPGTGDCNKLDATVSLVRSAQGGDSSDQVVVAIKTNPCTTGSEATALAFSVPAATVNFLIGDSGRTVTASGTVNAKDACIVTPAGPSCGQDATVTFSVNATCAPGNLTYASTDLYYFSATRTLDATTACEAGSEEKSTVTVSAGGETYTLSGAPIFTTYYHADTVYTTVSTGRRLLAHVAEPDEDEGEDEGAELAATTAAAVQRSAGADTQGEDSDEADEADADAQGQAAARRMAEGTTNTVTTTSFAVGANITAAGAYFAPCTDSAAAQSVMVTDIDGQVFNVLVRNLGCGGAKKPRPSGTFAFTVAAADVKAFTLTVPTKAKKSGRVKGTLSAKIVCFATSTSSAPTDCLKKTVKVKFLSAKPKCVAKRQYVRVTRGGRDGESDVTQVINGCDAGRAVTAKVTIGGRTYTVRAFSSWLGHVTATTSYAR